MKTYILALLCIIILSTNDTIFADEIKYNGYGNIGIGFDLYNKNIGDSILSIGNDNVNYATSKNAKNEPRAIVPELSFGFFIKPNIAIELTAINRYINTLKNHNTFQTNDNYVDYNSYQQTSGYLGLNIHKKHNNRLTVTAGASLGLSNIQSTWGSSVMPSVLINTSLEYNIYDNIALYGKINIAASNIKINATQQSSENSLATPFFQVPNNQIYDSKTILPQTKEDNIIPKDLEIFITPNKKFYNLKLTEKYDEEKVNPIVTNNLLALNNTLYNLESRNNDVYGATTEKDYDIGIFNLEPVYTIDQYIDKTTTNANYDYAAERFEDDNTSSIASLRFVGYKPKIEIMKDNENIVFEIDPTEIESTISLSAPIKDFHVEGRSIKNTISETRPYKDSIQEITNPGKLNVETKYGKAIEGTPGQPIDVDPAIDESYFIKQNLEKILQEQMDEKNSKIVFTVARKENSNQPIKQFQEFINNEQFIKTDGTPSVIHDGDVLNAIFPITADNIDSIDEKSPLFNLKKNITKLKEQSRLHSGQIGTSSAYIKNEQNHIEETINFIPFDISDVDENKKIIEHLSSIECYDKFLEIVNKYNGKDENGNSVANGSPTNANPELKFELGDQLKITDEIEELITLSQKNKPNTNRNNKSNKTTEKEYKHTSSDYFKPSSFVINTTLSIGIKFYF